MPLGANFQTPFRGGICLGNKCRQSVFVGAGRPRNDVGQNQRRADLFAGEAFLRRALFSALIISSVIESSILALRILIVSATREFLTFLTVRKVFFAEAPFTLLISLQTPSDTSFPIYCHQRLRKLLTPHPESNQQP
jgi:hypothetical protein